MNKYNIILLVLLYWNTTAAQAPIQIKGHEDCSTRLTIETKKLVGPSSSPIGYGIAKEFANNPKDDLYHLENENHSVWYQFVTKTTGTMTFEIAPLDSLDDYDFALYEYTGNMFCQDVINKKQLPIRTNFSRNKTEIGGRTGLDDKANNEFVPQGVQAAFSKPISVKKGDTLVLLVNSVYKNSSGHMLHFGYQSNRRLSTDPLPKPPTPQKGYVEEPSLVRWGGKVINEQGESVGNAKIVLKDRITKEVVAEATSDAVSGRYYLIFLTLEEQWKNPFYMEAQRHGYLYDSKTINQYQVQKGMHHKPQTLTLQILTKGKRFELLDINFPPKSTVPLNNSDNSIKSLLQVMQNNPTLQIKIEGNDNGCCDIATHQEYSEEEALRISEKRANFIAQFLIENGIESNRIQAIGKGTQNLLHANQSANAHLNNRITIEILGL